MLCTERKRTDRGELKRRVRWLLWQKHTQRGVHAPRETRQPLSPLRLPTLKLTCGPMCFSGPRSHCHRTASGTQLVFAYYTRAPCARVRSHRHHPIIPLLPRDKGRGPLGLAHRNQSCSSPARRDQSTAAASASPTPSLRSPPIPGERPDRSADGVHRRDAPRAAGQPPAQAAAARVGRRPRRDVPGYAAAARVGRRTRRDVSGIIASFYRLRFPFADLSIGMPIFDAQRVYWLCCGSRVKWWICRISVLVAVN